MYTSFPSRAKPRYPYESLLTLTQADGRTDGQSVCRHARITRHFLYALNASQFAPSLSISSIVANYRRTASTCFFSPTLALPFRLVTVLSSLILLFFLSRGFFPALFLSCTILEINRSTSTARVRGRRRGARVERDEDTFRRNHEADRYRCTRKDTNNSPRSKERCAGLGLETSPESSQGSRCAQTTILYLGEFMAEKFGAKSSD